MTLTETAGQRVAAWRKSRDWSQRTAASELSVSQGLLSDIEVGRVEPSRNFLQRLAERFQVSGDWILHGHGDMLLAPMPGFAGRGGDRVEPPLYNRPSAGDFRMGGAEYTMIERRRISVSAGSGLDAVEDGPTEGLAFSNAWLSRNRINADLAVLVDVRGDSMAPTIPEGALVLVHIVDKDVGREGVFAFVRHGEGFIKRILPVNKARDGRPVSVAILSDNPSYPPDVVVGEEMNDLRIVGRVRCVLTTLP